MASSVYHPQTCGKNERAHKTLRKWLAKKPAADTLTELQTQLDTYRQIYNNRRHQGIGGTTRNNVGTPLLPPNSHPGYRAEPAASSVPSRAPE
ncbi:integrase core domain-containing protein [Rhodococcus sp. NPDC058521]|uniref:integrase core domain-containing protein n=1 Tax=Rhodococcus sp. NPDC058521 TaxID=3346536 RepID=UPI0036497C26